MIQRSTAGSFSFFLFLRSQLDDGNKETFFKYAEHLKVLEQGQLLSLL